MDYQSLGLGEAASIITAVTLDEDNQAIIISCMYDPQDTQLLYKLFFKNCEHISWNKFDEFADLHKLDAELIGISLDESGPQKLVVITTDVFELSFFYGIFSLQTLTSTSYSTRI